MHFLWYVFILFLISSCSSVHTQAEVYDRQCSALELDAEIIRCYNQINSDIISRQITVATRRLTDGDWPHSFQMLIQLQVEKTGRFKVQSVLMPSNSRLMDKKITQVLNGIDEIFVPRNKLFESGGFSQLKLLVKPARTPLLGDEKLIDKGALVIYIHKVRR